MAGVGSSGIKTRRKKKEEGRKASGVLSGLEVGRGKEGWYRLRMRPRDSGGAGTERSRTTK